ncbi:insoluble matrix shell protein 6-like [Mytilus galloprovincialis]|uniref:insoluble matrix shell protein 6-like n=1 Tax=Mytilus galloprovincialis TaxID=29158 RepID=UPI003F7B7722
MKNMVLMVLILFISTDIVYSCHHHCNCPADKHPVCSTSGFTYDNECLLNCACPSKVLACRHKCPCRIS